MPMARSFRLPDQSPREWGGVTAELNRLSHDEKIERASELFNQVALKRIEGIGAGCSNTQQIIEGYGSFLHKISQAEVRDALELVTKENRMENDVFIDLRQESIQFSETLHAWLNEKYEKSHPIHHALVF